MDFIYIVLGMNTLIVFLFKRELLLSKKSFFMLFVLNLIFFVLAYILQQYSISNTKLVVALKMPILSQLLFIGLVAIFRKIYNRDPVDTFWTMDVNLMKDGIFNFIFWVIAIVIPAILAFTGII